MNTTCEHEDLLRVDPYGIMKQAKSGGNSTGRKGRWLFSKNTRSCFASSNSQISLRAQNQSFRKPLPWCPGQSPKGKRVRDSSCCLSSRHGGRSTETTSALTTIAVTTSCHTGNQPGAPELNTQLFSWTYNSSALKGF